MGEGNLGERSEKSKGTGKKGSKMHGWEKRREGRVGKGRFGLLEVQ